MLTTLVMLYVRFFVEGGIVYIGNFLGLLVLDILVTQVFLIILILRSM